MKGSRYFVSDPPVPLEKAYAELNFEMTGHSELLGRGHYYMTGCSKSNLDEIIKEFNPASEMLVDTLPIAELLFDSSDNASFSRIGTRDGVSLGIPSGTFATTALSEYLHTTSDEIGLMDLNNMADLVNHFGSLVMWLSLNRKEISFTDPRLSR